jgi:cholesterol transport system auxiliary component
MAQAYKIARIAGLLLLLFASSCVLGLSENNAARTYFLSPNVSWPKPPNDHQHVETVVLLISPPKAQAGFDTAQMIYLLRPYEIKYYAFSQWADTPAHLLQRILIENFDKAGLWSAVLSAPSLLPAQYRLDTDNLILEQQFFSAPSRIRFALRAQIVDLKKPVIIASRRFELFETAPSDDPYGGVQAANRAVEKLVTQIAEWLAENLRSY